MKPAYEDVGASSVVGRDVIKSSFGELAGTAIGRWMYQAARSAIGSGAGMAVPIVLFGASVGSWIGSAVAGVTAERRSQTRRYRRLRPGVALPLEVRIALSSFAHTAIADRAGVAQVTQAPAILGAFPREAAGFAAGHPVYERWTTTFYDGLSQIDDETYVLENQTVTITENITLRGTEGSETVVDHYTAMPGGILYQNTVTEPNGQIETETRVDTFEGQHKIVQNGSFARPDGVTVTFTGSLVAHGHRTVNNRTYHESNGLTYTIHEVDIIESEWQSSATVTTKWPDGSHQVDKDTVSGVMLSAPAT